MTNYEQGFIDKCAQHGVNPEELAKSAGFLNMLRKGWSKARPSFDSFLTKGLNEADIRAMGKAKSLQSRFPAGSFSEFIEPFRPSTMQRNIDWQEALRKSRGVRGTLEDFADKAIW